ncbi:BT4734/BF3469 family protein, partial [Psychroserpens sp.]|uniref:BT4734/BF3469 family protein n=1 Tax=Psychroserpens sp. TaxID=2020870 RepID=UPI002B2759B4
MLDFVAFSGRFNTRSREGLLNYSGLICMDFDNIKNPYKLLNEIIDLSLPLVMAFASPSGHGLKAIFKSCNNPEMHPAYFKYYESEFKNKLGVAVDKSGKDIPRACFVSHDPNVFYMNSKFVPGIELPESRSELFYDFADKYIQSSKDGEKHTKLTKVAYLAGGYYAMGIVGENETRAFLKKSIVNRGNLADVDLAFKTIDDCFEKGKSAPVSKEDIDKYLSQS